MIKRRDLHQTYGKEAGFCVSTKKIALWFFISPKDDLQMKKCLQVISQLNYS